MYDIVCLTYDIVYDICKNYDIVCVLVQVLAIFVYDVVYDIVRHIVVFAEIVYDMQMEYRYYTILYAYIVRFVCIIQYCTPISTKTYDNTVRCRTQYRNLRCDVRYCLPGAEFAADMPLERQQVLLHDPRPCRMVCTASPQS